MDGTTPGRPWIVANSRKPRSSNASALACATVAIGFEAGVAHSSCHRSDLPNPWAILHRYAAVVIRLFIGGSPPSLGEFSLRVLFSVGAIPPRRFRWPEKGTGNEYRSHHSHGLPMAGCRLTV
jgi:hypothetical protein